jgi:hypothetical protein
MRYFSVKNYDRYQQYRGKGIPHWIKLHREVFGDFKFSRLPVASRLHLVLIWLLASQHGNRVPCDALYVQQRIGAPEPVDLELLIKSGFLLDAGDDLAEPLVSGAVSTPTNLSESGSDLSLSLSAPDPRSLTVVTPTRAGARKDPALLADFKGFWLVYPRKDGKQYAAQCWSRLTEDERRLATEDIPKRLTANWAGRDLDKIPHASTYLNQRRWLDEITPMGRLPDPRPHLSPGMQRLGEAFLEAKQRERNGSSPIADADQGDVVETTGRSIRDR